MSSKGNYLRDKFNNLLCVKSIMTVSVTVTLCILTILYPDTYSEVFRNISVMIATFYFAHQTDKREAVNYVVDRNDTDLRGGSRSDVGE